MDNQKAARERLQKNPHFKWDAQTREQFGMGTSSGIPAQAPRFGSSVPQHGAAVKVEDELLPLNTQQVVRNPKSFKNGRLNLKPHDRRPNDGSGR